MTTLNANIRTSGEKLDTIRQAGNIPAIVYGAGITETVHISLERESFKKAWKTAGGARKHFKAMAVKF
jgi:ribosomal protein L25 (general stress protein Ctc)